MITRLQGACALAACLAFAGCREDWQADTYPASGRVSINGEAPAGAIVQLHPTGGGGGDARRSRPWGLVGDDGSFVLSTYDGEPGAPAGDYKLTLTWPPDASRPSLVDRLRSKYSSPDRSPWNVTIKQGENVLPAVELTNVDVDRKTETKFAEPATGLTPPTATARPRRAKR
ncbi:hypothetical protein [Paludisphaera mucosa]|uniref:Carboxypeptidase regulatory-like domain-containing protein n=1 Tax=Paludisphaera mucosa TaxID=3030827 RepID=A0ABT6FB88_9BACT|nr:hypothetical protein [Paludisphaera mucosa]MDG3004854.1 hypothetical protein [Paludisphaera mucosa]